MFFTIHVDNVLTKFSGHVAATDKVSYSTNGPRRLYLCQPGVSVQAVLRARDLIMPQ